MKEIERKYWINRKKFMLYIQTHTVMCKYISQSYLVDQKTNIQIDDVDDEQVSHRVLRVREVIPFIDDKLVSKDRKFYLTMKESISDSEYPEEYEDEISSEMGNALMFGKRITKYRYYVPLNNIFVMEVDVFANPALEHITIGEVEVDSQDQFTQIELPDFVQGRLQDEFPYKNSNLFKRI